MQQTSNQGEDIDKMGAQGAIAYFEQTMVDLSDGRLG
jgi:hypothetical protein